MDTSLHPDRDCRLAHFPTVGAQRGNGHLVRADGTQSRRPSCLRCTLFALALVVMVAMLIAITAFISVQWPRLDRSVAIFALRSLGILCNGP
jgi:hypothetical protein